MKPNTVIHEFHPVVYPIRLWVTISSDFEAISERFEYYPSGDKIETSESNLFAAFTYRVKKKETGHMGVLLVFCTKKHCTIKNIAHEATHAARWIWNHLGEDRPALEADAYLVGWICECIEKVKNG